MFLLLQEKVDVNKQCLLYLRPYAHFHPRSQAPALIRHSQAGAWERLQRGSASRRYLEVEPP